MHPTIVKHIFTQLSYIPSEYENHESLAWSILLVTKSDSPFIRIWSFSPPYSFWFYCFLFPLFWCEHPFLIPSMRIIEDRLTPEAVSSTLHKTPSSVIFLPDNKFILSLRRSHCYESTGENNSQFPVQMTPKTVKISSTVNLVKSLTFDHQHTNPPMSLSHCVDNNTTSAQEKTDCNSEFGWLQKTTKNDSGRWSGQPAVDCIVAVVSGGDWCDVWRRRLSGRAWVMSNLTTDLTCTRPGPCFLGLSIELGQPNPTLTWAQVPLTSSLNLNRKPSCPLTSASPSAVCNKRRTTATSPTFYFGARRTSNWRSSPAMTIFRN